MRATRSRAAARRECPPSKPGKAPSLAAARPHLGNDRREAEDLVHDLCVEVLEGRLPLPSEPAEALRLLVGEIIDRCADDGR